MESANLRLQQAIAAARAGKKDEAKVLAESLIQDQPDNAHALFLRGMLSDSSEEQVDYMNQVLAIDPDHPVASKRLAQLNASVEEEAQTVVASVPAEEPHVEVEEFDDFEEEAAEAEIAAILESPIEPEEEEVVLTEEDLAAAAVVGTMINEPPLDVTKELEEEAIPDWLKDLDQDEELEPEAGIFEFEEELEIERADDLPDWLQEEPQQYVAPEPKEVEGAAVATGIALAAEEPLEEVLPPVQPLEEKPTPVEPLPEEPQPPDEKKPKSAPAKRKSSSTRGLEILLVILVVIAFLILAALVYVLLNPPSI